MEKNWLNLMNLFKRILTSTAIVHNLKNKKKICNELVEETSSEFRSSEKRINSDTLIDKYKTEGRSLKDFRN